MEKAKGIVFKIAMFFFTGFGKQIVCSIMIYLRVGFFSSPFLEEIF